MIARVIYSFIGATAGVISVFVITSLLGALFGPLYKNEDDMTRNLMIVLGASFTFAIIGAFAGWRIRKKMIQNTTELTE